MHTKWAVKRLQLPLTFQTPTLTRYTKSGSRASAGASHISSHTQAYHVHQVGQIHSGSVRCSHVRQQDLEHRDGPAPHVTPKAKLLLVLPWPHLLRGPAIVHDNRNIQVKWFICTTLQKFE